jgi:hypothetical protein
MTPENFDEYAGVIDNLADWERWHNVFIYGSKEDKAALVADLKGFPIWERERLFREGFDYRGWLRGFLRIEPIQPEPQNETRQIKIHVERVQGNLS